MPKLLARTLRASKTQVLASLFVAGGLSLGCGGKSTKTSDQKSPPSEGNEDPTQFKTVVERTREDVKATVKVAGHGTKDEVYRNELESKEGKIVTQYGKGLPENFPKDIPVYPEATIANSMVSDAMVMLLMKTEKTWAEVKPAYRKLAESQGWKEHTQPGLPETDLSFKKGKAFLNVSGQKGKDKLVLRIVRNERK